MPQGYKVCHLLLGAANEIAGIQKYLTSLMTSNDFAVINAAPLFENYLTSQKKTYYLYKNILGFFQIIQAEKPQLIHVHLGKGIFPAWYSKLKYPQVKLIYTQHFISPAHTNNKLFFLKNTILKIFFKKFAAIIAISQAVADGIKKRREIAKNKIKLIYNGIALPNKLSPKKMFKPNILSVCRLEKEKQPEKILELARLAPNFNFTLAGSGALLEKIKKSAPSNLKVLGYVKNIDQLLKNNSFFFFPAKAEPFGLAVIEALSYGLPVIAYKSGALAEIISPIEGFLLDPISSLTSARNFITDLINNPKLYQKMSQACFKKAKQFSLKQMQVKTYALYRSLSHG